MQMYQRKLQPLTPMHKVQGVSKNMCSHTAALIAAASCGADPDLVGGGGGSTLVVSSCSNFTGCWPALCTLTFSPYTCGGITDLCP